MSRCSPLYTYRSFQNCKFILIPQWNRSDIFFLFFLLFFVFFNDLYTSIKNTSFTFTMKKITLFEKWVKSLLRPNFFKETPYWKAFEGFWKMTSFLQYDYQKVLKMLLNTGHQKMTKKRQKWWKIMILLRIDKNIKNYFFHFVDS